jgi:glycosyltransferase involved in cell wall biosynthesis
VLFIQTTDPAAYPPLINAAMIMAEANWHVTFLSAPIRGSRLALPAHQNITIRSIPPRPSHVVSKLDYFRYVAMAAQLALRLRPDVVYVSDHMGACPGLLAARLTKAILIYHEHDSPAPGSLMRSPASARATAARSARVVIFPNETRARIVQSELGLAGDRVRVIWNMPRRAELPPRPLRVDRNRPLIVYYHGSITPERLPEAVVAAICRTSGNARLRLAGYEAPGARGYIASLLARDRIIEYVGELRYHEDLLREAAHADLGLALMPRKLDDINMIYMAGASNKAFDYMAAGLPFLVSNLPEWRRLYVEPGYARACDPEDGSSVADALNWFIHHPTEREAMASRARAKIEADWNYDTAFAPVMRALADACGPRPRE